MFIFIINEHNELEVKFMKKIIIFLLSNLLFIMIDVP